MAQDEHLTWRQRLLGHTADDNTMAAAHWSPVSGDAETPMAWSQDDYTQYGPAFQGASPTVDYPLTAPAPVSESHNPWSWAVTTVTVIVLLGMVTVLGLLVWHHGPQVLKSSPTTVTVTASAPTAVPASTMPQVVAPPTMTPDPAKADDTYVSIVESNGLYIYDRAPMIKLGHQQCALLAQGETVSDAINALEDTYSDLRKYPREAYGVVMGAVTAYCPQYKGG